MGRGLAGFAAGLAGGWLAHSQMKTQAQLQKEADEREFRRQTRLEEIRHGYRMTEADAAAGHKRDEIDTAGGWQVNVVDAQGKNASDVANIGARSNVNVATIGADASRDVADANQEGMNLRHGSDLAARLAMQVTDINWKRESQTGQFTHAVNLQELQTQGRLKGISLEGKQNRRAQKLAAKIEKGLRKQALKDDAVRALIEEQIEKRLMETQHEYGREITADRNIAQKVFSRYAMELAIEEMSVMKEMGRTTEESGIFGKMFTDGPDFDRHWWQLWLVPGDQENVIKRTMRAENVTKDQAILMLQRQGLIPK